MSAAPERHPGVTARGLSATRAWDLFLTGKPRVTALFLLTAWVGSVLSSAQLWSGRTPAMIVGLGSVLAGAAALNQYLERHRDGLMERTRGRALPQGRLSPAWVLVAGSLACSMGLVVLGVWVRPVCAVLAAAGAAYYLLAYTLVLKPRTPRSAVVGGPAGIFPFLVGWAAGGGPFTLLALYVCALVFLWSPAHFWAIAVSRSDEFARAGLPTPVSIRGRRHAGLLILLYSAATVAASTLPVVGSGFGAVYLVVALIAGAVFSLGALRVCRSPVERNARLLYKLSGPYLGAILLALVVDRLW